MGDLTPSLLVRLKFKMDLTTNRSEWMDDSFASWQTRFYDAAESTDVQAHRYAKSISYQLSVERDGRKARKWPLNLMVKEREKFKSGWSAGSGEDLATDALLVLHLQLFCLSMKLYCFVMQGVTRRRYVRGGSCTYLLFPKWFTQRHLKISEPYRVWAAATNGTLLVWLNWRPNLYKRAGNLCGGRLYASPMRHSTVLSESVLSFRTCWVKL